MRGIPSSYYHYTWLIFILILAIGLRIYRIDKLTLGNDDLSALSRLQYDSFHELIEKGVKPDGHPAGVQVFLYYWTRWMGNTEWMLRLPFLLMGLGAMVLAFHVASKWFNPTVGLLLASCMACWEYFIIHSLSIRPYISGLFFAWGMVYCWSYVCRLLQPIKWFHWMGFVLFSVLCAYNHYFSLLLAFWVGISGLFVIPGKYIANYIYAGLAIVTLYIPHIPIFQAQLAIGGIGGWLAPPNRSFLLHYISYIFHFSPWMYGSILILLIVGIGLRIKQGYQQKEWKITLISGSWFVLSFVVAYVYSVKVNPVLHYGVLFFSFPFALLGVFSVYPRLPLFKESVLISVLLLSSIFTLIWDRDHYGIFYDRGAKAMMNDFEAWKEDPRITQLTRVGIAHNPFYLNYYVSNDSLERYNLPDLQTFDQWLSELTSDALAIGWVSNMMPLEYLALIHTYYPHLAEYKMKSVSEWFLFSKKHVSTENNLPIIHHSHVDSISLYSHFLFPEEFKWHNEEYIPPIELTDTALYQLKPWLLTYAQIEVRDSSDALPLWVISIEKEGEVLHWQKGDFILRDSKRQAFAVNAVRFRHLPFRFTNDMVVKIHIWNPNRVSWRMDAIDIQLWEGNPELYILVEDRDD